MSKQLLDYAGRRIMFLGSVEGKLGQRSTHGPQKQRENFLENQINLLILVSSRNASEVFLFLENKKFHRNHKRMNENLLRLRMSRTGEPNR